MKFATACFNENDAKFAKKVVYAKFEILWNIFGSFAPACGVQENVFKFFNV